MTKNPSDHVSETVRDEAGAIRFEATVQTAGARALVRLPTEASKALPSRGQVAVRAVIGDGLDRRLETEFDTVMEPDGEFGHWMNLDASHGLSAGDRIVAEVTPTRPWPEPTVPDDLADALATAPEAIRDLWAAITPMARWEWVRWVNATRNPSTRQRRVEVGISKMSDGKRRPCCFNLASCTDPELSRSGKLRLD